MQRWIAVAALEAMIAVAAGAFGAHALKSRLAPDLLAVFETAAKYQMYHALALLAWALWLPSRAATGSLVGLLFVAGTVLFSGSLYALSLSGMRALGAITPLGGTVWIMAWGLWAWQAWTAGDH